MQAVRFCSAIYLYLWLRCRLRKRVVTLFGLEQRFTASQAKMSPVSGCGSFGRRSRLLGSLFLILSALLLSVRGECRAPGVDGYLLLCAFLGPVQRCVETKISPVGLHWPMYVDRQQTSFDSWSPSLLCVCVCMSVCVCVCVCARVGYSSQVLHYLS